MLGDYVSWMEVEKKVGQYHAFGVDAVWVIDPHMLAVRVYPRGGESHVLQSDARVVTAHPAGFSCAVKDFFA